MDTNPLIRRSNNGSFYNLNFENDFVSFQNEINGMFNHFSNLIDSLQKFKREPANNKSGETERLKEHRLLEWKNRSIIKDVFCRYGGYYS